MRILLFIIWLTLGLVYGMIWLQQRESCCQTGIPVGSVQSPETETNAAPSIMPSSPPVLDNKLSPSSARPFSQGQSVSTPPITDELAVPEDAGCVLFKWGKSDPILKPCFESFRDSIAKSMIKGKELELINEYYEQENQVMASGDIGLIRSAKLKELFALKINAENIRIRSKARSDSTGKKNRLLYTLQTRQIFMNDQVKELDEKTLIYFKYASNQHENDVLVNAYVADLVDRIKSTSDQVRLVGHTDDDATAEHNQILGLRRAQLIKNLLIAKGIKASRITVDSRGELEPMAPNDTEENRKQNRRVELTLIPTDKSN